MSNYIEELEGMVSQAQRNINDLEREVEALRTRNAEMEAEVGRLREALEKIENATVEFHECGPYEINEGLKRVMGIYDIAKQALSQKAGKGGGGE